MGTYIIILIIVLLFAELGGFITKETAKKWIGRIVVTCMAIVALYFIGELLILKGI